VVSVVGAVALSHEHDDFAWVDAPDELELTDAAATAFSLAS
jgi:hypothetical protein